MPLLWDSSRRGTFRIHPTMPRYLWRNLAYGRKPKGNTTPMERRAIHRAYREKLEAERSK